MSALALSVLLSFVSAVTYAGGAIVQEQVAVSCPDGSYMPLRRAGWWAGLALNGLGGVLHVVALAYGPLSLVQPLGALTIVFASSSAAGPGPPPGGARSWPRWASPGCCPWSARPTRTPSTGLTGWPSRWSPAVRWWP